MASLSLSAPVTAQVREYSDPTIGVAMLDETLTVMVGSGDEKMLAETLIQIKVMHHFPSTVLA